MRARDVSVEKDFYGREGGTSVDAQITDLERVYTSLVDELRNMEDQTQVSHLKVAELVTHLAVRSKHLRDSFRKSSEFIIEKMDEYFLDYNNVKAFIENNPELLQEEFKKHLGNYPVPRQYKNKLFQALLLLLPSFLEEQRPEIHRIFQFMTAGIKSVLPAALKAGHIDALAKSPVPEPRVEDYRLLQWFICKVEETFILGDFGCLFEIAEPKRFTTLNARSDQITNVFLPISSNRILVGTSVSGMLKLDPNVINQAIAKSSRDFFVSSSPKLIDLIPSIGENSEMISKEELEGIVAELKREKLTAPYKGKVQRVRKKKKRRQR